MRMLKKINKVRVFILMWLLSHIKFYQTKKKRAFFKIFFKLIQKFKREKANYSFDQNDYPWLNNLFEDGFMLKQFNLKNKFGIIDALGPIHNKVVSEANDLISGAFPLQHSHYSKDYLRQLDLSKIPTKKLKLFYQYFTHPVFLNTAAAYLKDKPLLTELKILISPPINKINFEGSQVFHSDFDDERNLKIFVFLDDVLSNSGPLEAINLVDSSRLMEEWGYKWGKKNISHNDNIAKSLPKEKITSFLGPQGSVCLIDSVSCLHRGSRNPIRSRKILYATYNTRTSFRFPPLNWIGLLPKINSISSPLSKLDPSLSFINENALNL